MSERPLAVVTGAARRVGRATALALARAGHDLVITYRASADEAAATRADVEATGARCRAERVDLGAPADVEAFGRTLAALPRLDALVHNASSFGPTPLETLDEDVAIGHYRVNALSPLVLTAAAAPLLRACDRPGGAAVVCFTDIYVLGRPRPGYVAYSMAKAALAHMVHALARDLAPEVRVNGIAPGAIAWPEDKPDAEIEAYLARVPLARSGTPEDAAEAVRWLVDDARYVTGQIIRLDGGRWLT